MHVLVVVAGLALVTACSKSRAEGAPDLAADVIYAGGDIVTINDAQPTAEALAVKDGRILAVGARSVIEATHKGADTTIVELGGKTLLPGFIDPHSHYFSSLSVANQVNVFAPPAGPGRDIPSIVAALKAFREQRSLPKGTLIQAYGYDENAMPNGVALTRDDLDRDFPDHPVLVGHVSMHGAVMETAYLPIFMALPKPTAEQEIEWSRACQMLYAAAGNTTAHEGVTHATDLALMQRAAAAGANIIDVVAYPFFTDLDAVLAKNPLETRRYPHAQPWQGSDVLSQPDQPHRLRRHATRGPPGNHDQCGRPVWREGVEGLPGTR